eukprot:TRINITY_DN4090_c0_g2_i2.p1 TRINITY_DN4090_c0_g2~~TRINITY_DN4090_c0_g2_i2.p1  ORF type:complete len:850 (+),score=72.99 TRINITY_DN4090_c0_g2_i2:28-2577(+)
MQVYGEIRLQRVSVPDPSVSVSYQPITLRVPLFSPTYEENSFRDEPEAPQLGPELPILVPAVPEADAALYIGTAAVSIGQSSFPYLHFKMTTAKAPFQVFSRLHYRGSSVFQDPRGLEIPPNSRLVLSQSDCVDIVLQNGQLVTYEVCFFRSPASPVGLVSAQGRFRIIAQLSSSSGPTKAAACLAVPLQLQASRAVLAKFENLSTVSGDPEAVRLHSLEYAASKQLPSHPALPERFLKECVNNRSGVCASFSEYVSGLKLSAYLRHLELYESDESLVISSLWACLRDVLEATVVTTSGNFIHRKIEEATIYVRRMGERIRATIVDFSAVAEINPQEGTQDRVGSLEVAAPEMAISIGADGRPSFPAFSLESDFYAVGVAFAKVCGVLISSPARWDQVGVDTLEDAFLRSPSHVQSFLLRNGPLLDLILRLTEKNPSARLSAGQALLLPGLNEYTFHPAPFLQPKTGVSLKFSHFYDGRELTGVVFAEKPPPQQGDSSFQFCRFVDQTGKEWSAVQLCSSALQMATVKRVFGGNCPHLLSGSWFSCPNDSELFVLLDQIIVAHEPAAQLHPNSQLAPTPATLASLIAVALRVGAWLAGKPALCSIDRRLMVCNREHVDSSWKGMIGELGIPVVAETYRQFVIVKDSTGVRTAFLPTKFLSMRGSKIDMCSIFSNTVSLASAAGKLPGCYQGWMTSTIYSACNFMDFYFRMNILDSIQPSPKSSLVAKFLDKLAWGSVAMGNLSALIRRFASPQCEPSSPSVEPVSTALLRMVEFPDHSLNLALSSLFGTFSAKTLEIDAVSHSSFGMTPNIVWSSPKAPDNPPKERHFRVLCLIEEAERCVPLLDLYFL